jgi:hypothetical protein
VVADDRIDRAVGETCPQPVLIGAVTDRRGALVVGRAVDDVLGGESELAADRCRTWACAPVARTPSIRAVIAASSAASGRLSSQLR